MNELCTRQVTLRHRSDGAGMEQVTIVEPEYESNERPTG